MLLILHKTIWLKILTSVGLVDVKVQRPGIGDSIALDMFLGKLYTKANDIDSGYIVQFLIRELLYICYNTRRDILSTRIGAIIQLMSSFTDFIKFCADIYHFIALILCMFCTYGSF